MNLLTCWRFARLAGLAAWRMLFVGCIALGVAPTWAHDSGDARAAKLAVEVSLEGAVWYLKEGATELSASQVRDQWLSGRFLPLDQRGVSGSNFGFQKEAVWSALPLSRVLNGRGKQGQRGWVLELDYPMIDNLKLTIFDAGGRVILHKVGGDQVPFDKRDILYRSHAFELPDDLPQGAIALLRTQSAGVVSMPLRLYAAPAFARASQNAYFLLAMYFGLLGGLMAYNLLIGLQLRDTRFIWYVGFGLGMAGIQLSTTGLGAEYVWPDQFGWQQVSAAVSIGLAGLFGLQFTRNYLDTSRNMPAVDRALGGGVMFAALATLSSTSLPLEYSTLSNTFLASYGVGVILLAAIVGIMRKVSGAGFFLLAWSSVLTGAVVLVLHNNALVPTNALTHHSLLVGSAIEMVLLSLALGNRMRMAQVAKEAAIALAKQEHIAAQALQESKMANDALLVQREALLNNTLVGMVLSIDRRHTWINDKFVQMMGYPRERMVGSDSAYLHASGAERDAFAVAARVSLAAHGTYNGSARLLRCDGRVIFAQVAGACLTPGDLSKGVVWTILDVTDQRASDEQARIALQTQRELTQTRERFVAMTSHELRTPVAAILGTLELFRHYGQRLSEPEKADMLVQINTAAERLWDMTERVLLHGKGQSGGMLFSPVLADAAMAIGNACKEVCRDPSNHIDRLHLHIKLPAGRLLFDPALLRHVVVNLVGNAYKYSPLGGPVTVTASLLTLGPGKPQLEVRIADQGIGIPPESLPLLFQGFHRAANVADISGTGLGLSIVKHCVDAHLGHVSVNAPEGGGTAFVVRLPVEVERSE